MSNVSKIDKLQALLARIQRHAGEPRPMRLQLSPPRVTAPRASTLETLEISAAPMEPMVVEPIAAHMKMPARAEEAPPAIEHHEAPVAEGAIDETATVSGEYAVAEMALELEELGPADEFETSGETVVEIDVGEPIEAVEVPSSREQRQEPERHPEPAQEEEEEAPTSGRELVAAPHESARVMVAAPSSSREEEARVDENAPIDLGDFGETPPPEELEDEESLARTHEMAVAPPIPPPPPSSRRERPLAPPPPPPEPPTFEAPVHQVAIVTAPSSAPPPAPVGMDSLRHTDVNVGAPLVAEVPPPAAAHEEEEPAPATMTGEELDALSGPHPVRHPTPPPPPLPPPPVVEAVVEVPAGPPEQVVVAVALQAPSAHAKPTIEQVFVAIEAVVIKPDLTPIEVAKMVGAVREPRPQTFGALIDAALDL